MPLLIALKSKFSHYLLYLMLAIAIHALLFFAFIFRENIPINGSFNEDFASKSSYQNKSARKEKMIDIHIKRIKVKALKTDILEEIPPKKERKKIKTSHYKKLSEIKESLKNKTALKQKGQTTASKKGDDFSLKGEALNNYKALVFKKIAKNRYYPFFEKERGHEGRVLLCFTILKNGAVKNIRILKACSYARLNQSAKKTIVKSAPFLALPKGMNDFKMKVLINYKIRK